MPSTLSSSPLFAVIRTTAFGELGLLWNIAESRPGIVRIVLPRPGLPPPDQLFKVLPCVAEQSCAAMDTATDDIEGLLEGQDISFSLDLVRLELCSPFQRAVLSAEHAVPRGAVCTYQGVARHLGIPGGARAVGGALARNPFPLVVPCHRAIRSDRTLGGFQGGLSMKRALLEMEGLVLDDAGHVSATDFYA